MATRSAASVHSASRCSDVPAENRSAMRTTSAPSRSSCSSTPESCRVRERSPRRASPRSIASTRCPETAMLGMERSSSRRTWTVALALTGTTRSRTRTSLPARLKSRRCSRTWRRRLLGACPRPEGGGTSRQRQHDDVLGRIRTTRLDQRLAGGPAARMAASGAIAAVSRQGSFRNTGPADHPSLRPRGQGSIDSAPCKNGTASRVDGRPAARTISSACSPST